MSGTVPPRLDPELAAGAIGLAIRGTLADAGREGWVVGLSGGVDSALAATLAARAVGPERVHALFLPAGPTPPAAEATARGVAEWLGIDLATVPLDDLAAAAPVPEDDRVRRGNLLGRLRMALLYDRAAERRALVLGTSNRTEIALGYTTLWGDMAADLWPLGDLYKTQVLWLAGDLGLPAEVLDREPSAELWAGQTDEAELGFSYGDADGVLYYYLDERRRPAEIEAEGVLPGTVDAVLARVRSEAHKRRLPWAPKLSVRTVGQDFHHPRAWRGPA